jgi:hypothetical protein
MSQHTIGIQANNGLAVAFATSSSSADEHAGTVNVELLLLAASDTTVTVSYSVGGTATPGVDYTAPGLDYATREGQVTFNPGQTTRSVSVTIVDDKLAEAHETVILTLTSATNAALGATRDHTFTIYDNDRKTATQRWRRYL